MKHNTTQYNTIQYNTTQQNNTKQTHNATQVITHNKHTLKLTGPQLKIKS